MPKLPSAGEPHAEALASDRIARVGYDSSPIAVEGFASSSAGLLRAVTPAVTCVRGRAAGMTEQGARKLCKRSGLEET